MGPAGCAVCEPRYTRYRVEFAAFLWEPQMEAERLNTIESSLADLDARTRELRRYL